jgi:hypothetical protein
MIARSARYTAAMKAVACQPALPRCRARLAPRREDYAQASDSRRETCAVSKPRAFPACTPDRALMLRPVVATLLAGSMSPASLDRGCNEPTQRALVPA